MSSLYEANIDSFCWNRNLDVAGVFTGWFIYTPVVAWFGFIGFATFSRDLYVQVMALSYWLSVLVNTLLQALVLQLHPNPSCAPGLGWPSWAAQLAAHRVVMLALHRWFWGIPATPFSFCQTVLSIVVIPVVLVVSGNDSWNQMLSGLGVGAVMGIFTMYMMVFFWMDRIDIICGTHIFRKWMGYRTAVTKFYAKRTHKNNSRNAEGATMIRKFIAPNDNTADEDILNQEHAELLDGGEDDVLGQEPPREAERRRHVSTHRILRIFA